MYPILIFYNPERVELELNPQNLFIIGSTCCFQWKQGFAYIGTCIFTCGEPAKFKSTKPNKLGPVNVFCHKHWNRTQQGTLSKKAWLRKKKSSSCK